MKTFSFDGGVFLPEVKRAEPAQLETLPIPDRVVIPLLQHAGTPAIPIVKVGDSVKAGQKIGEATGAISANIHSSVSGDVIALAPFPHPSGQEVLSFVIETGETDEQIESITSADDWRIQSPAEIKNAIMEAGVVGLGGSSFPTHVKLFPAASEKIDTLIINGFEREPYLTSNRCFMLERSADLINGIRILLRALNGRHAQIALEENKTDVFKKLQSEIGEDPQIQCVRLSGKYPQGSERQLIYSITKREVPSEGLPPQCGCVVLNAGTVIAVREAVVLKKALTERVITVTGSGVRKSKNLKVKIGTLLRTVLSFCEGITQDCRKIICGGPMMGVTQWTLEVPVIKGTTGILCLAEKDIPREAQSPCISCGACVSVCPMRLLPCRIVQNVELRRFEKAETLHVMDCIECGSCAYVCPSHINLVHYLQWGKMEITNKREKNQEPKWKEML